MGRNNKDIKKWLETGNFVSENDINEFLENLNNETYLVAFSDDESNSSDSSGDKISEYNETLSENESMADFIVNDEFENDDASYVD